MPSKVVSIADAATQDQSNGSIAAAHDDDDWLVLLCSSLSSYQ